VRFSSQSSSTNPVSPSIAACNIDNRVSALAIGELVSQVMADLGGTVECGEMAVREEARGLLLPTAIFARWSR